MAPRGWAAALEFTCDCLVVVLALAGDKMNALVGSELALEDEDAGAAHAGELGVAVEVVLDGGAELRPLRDGL